MLCPEATDVQVQVLFTRAPSREGQLDVILSLIDEHAAGEQEAEITFDRYHVRSHLSKAIDEIRREEAKQHKQLLKNTRYLWLKRPANLTARQQDLLDELLQQPLETVRAYDFSLRFYELDDPDAAEEYLRRWIAEVHTSGLPPLIKFTRMLEDHWLGVIRWHHSRVSNECSSSAPPGGFVVVMPWLMGSER